MTSNHHSADDQLISQSDHGGKSAEVLRLTDVTFRASGENSLCLDKANLIVKQGDLLFVHLTRSQNPRDLCGLIQGIQKPESGKVTFVDEAWTDFDPERQFERRARIGRVFDRNAWLNNLNVTENVTLASQHHAIPEAQLQKELANWSDKLHVPRLSRERTAFVEASRLQRFQWLRAFINQPILLLLERPMRSVDPELLDAFHAGVAQIRESGTAVIWFTGTETEAKHSLACDARQYCIKQRKLQSVDVVVSNPGDAPDVGGER